MSRLKRLHMVLASALIVVVALASDVGAPRAQDAETAEEVFHEYISAPVVQSKCVNCHVEGGVSGHTRLVFVRQSDAPDHEDLNLRTFENLLDAVEEEGGGTYILNKIQGVAHGGGAQVPVETAAFANMQRFLGLLGEEIASAALTPETPFDTVVMASPRKTLRRAALIFAGRIPTDEEYAAVEGGDETALRATIRGLMEGPEFHEFLIRASNDRLLTDRGAVIDPGFFVDYLNEDYRRKKAAHDSGDERAWEDYYDWKHRLEYGVTRAPLELIAHVVENDLPYTEILTADYIMANPWTAAAYGASTRFGDPTDPYEFRPSRIVNYYRHGEGFEIEDDPEIGAAYVIDPGPLWTDYPHAGILNTTSFLQRYPSTATNRNRARSRWTYYHFLGVDVEKSASRTTDPAALADTNNPTLHNPNCTVCHSILDPVAGAFQNYGDNGFYKDQWGGMDSLDEFYKDGWTKVRETFEITAESRAEQQTVSIRAWLPVGREMVRIAPYFDPPRPDGSDIWWNMGIEHVAVRDGDGVVVSRLDLETVAEELDLCGSHEPRYDHTSTRDTFYEAWFCDQRVPVEIPEDGVYDVELVVWVEYQHHDVANQRRTLDLSVGGYQEGDTWYRDMRVAGFDGAAAPHSDNSLQWLAQQIVADPRFAEATVEFWWPAIMGSEVAEAPEDASDADFEGRLLAFNAQDAEVVRLAQGFRDGFPGSPYTYNLKDLLVEIVLSEWFRADAVTDADPVRRVALHDAGARRLLTPEELARKTGAITGVQWGRHIRTGCWPECAHLPNALTSEYRLLYGGIDSDGITERARDITSVMAGVARRHAEEVSCPVVMREVYLLPDAERRLFAGIDPRVTPASEFSDVFEITTASRAKKETLSLSGPLTAGSKTVRVTFTNDYWDEVQGDRNVFLHRLDVRNAAGRIVATREAEAIKSKEEGDCNRLRRSEGNFALYCQGSVEVSFDVSAAQNYKIDIVVSADQAGDELPRLSVTVESDSKNSAGAAAIRNKLVELHDKLLGVQVTPDSPDVEAAYRLFVDVWQRGYESRDDWFDWCGEGGDILFFEGILDDVIVQHENEDGHRWYEHDWDRVDDFMDGIDFSDPSYTAQTWVAVLAAMLMDYRYLYLN